jgi:hypothetical protein
MSESPRPLQQNPSEHRIRDWGIAALLSAGVSLAVLAPFFVLGTASGHDIAFHMASWLDAAGQWKQGVVFPRWTEWANFGFGEPRFIFYPPLSWLFGALLGTILPWSSVAAIFIGCVQTFAGISGFALFRRLADSRFGALLAAACFAANPYNLLIIYVRSDFAELLAIAFFPLLLLATLRLAGLLADQEPNPLQDIVLFAIWFCTVWLCNAPAGVIATYSAVFLIVAAAVRRRSLLPVANGGAGILLGFCLAAFYLIPAIYEQRWVQISAALYRGLMPADNFLYVKTSDVEHDAFNRVASHIAMLLIAWTVPAAVAARRYSSDKGSNDLKSNTLAAVTALSGAAILLMFPVTSIWWRYLPELKFVQFPWRWMSVLALCLASFVAVSARAGLRWACLLLSVVLIGGSAHYMVRHSWWDTEDMPTLQAAMRQGIGFEGTDEYDPAGDDHAELAQKSSRASLLATDSTPETRAKTKIAIEKWTAEHRSLRVITARPAHIELRLLNYPAWRVTINGSVVSPGHAEETGQMIIPVPAGESDLHVDFTRTADRTIGGWISVASVAASVAVLFYKRRISQGAQT